MLQVLSGGANEQVRKGNQGDRQAMLEHVNSYKEIFAARPKEDRAHRGRAARHRGDLKAIEVLKEKSRRRGEPEDAQDVEDIGRKLGPAIPSIQVGRSRTDRTSRASPAQEPR
jgi:hypothetical protein